MYVFPPFEFFGITELFRLSSMGNIFIQSVKNLGYAKKYPKIENINFNKKLSIKNEPPPMCAPHD